MIYHQKKPAMARAARQIIDPGLAEIFEEYRVSAEATHR
jgi:hypothetical protein